MTWYFDTEKIVEPTLPIITLSLLMDINSLTSDKCKVFRSKLFYYEGKVWKEYPVLLPLLGKILQFINSTRSKWIICSIKYRYTRNMYLFKNIHLLVGKYLTTSLWHYPIYFSKVWEVWSYTSPFYLYKVTLERP